MTTDNQVLCDGDPIQTIEYTVTGLPLLHII